MRYLPNSNLTNVRCACLLANTSFPHFRNQESICYFSISSRNDKYLINICEFGHFSNKKASKMLIFIANICRVCGILSCHSGKGAHNSSNDKYPSHTIKYLPFSLLSFCQISHMQTQLLSVPPYVFIYIWRHRNTCFSNMCGRYDRALIR